MARVSSDNLWLDRFLDGERVVIIHDTMDEAHRVLRIAYDGLDKCLVRGYVIDLITLKNGGSLRAASLTTPLRGRGTTVDHIEWMQTGLVDPEVFFTWKPALRDPDRCPFKVLYSVENL